MTAIDTEVIMLGVILMSPIYVYLHKMSLTLSKFTTIVETCKYCTHGKPKSIIEEAERDEL